MDDIIINVIEGETTTVSVDDTSGIVISASEESENIVVGVVEEAVIGVSQQYLGDNITTAIQEGDNIRVLVEGNIGPQGPTGPYATIIGPTGPQGLPSTVTGPQGEIGPTGMDGATGPQGDFGPTGIDGPTGPQGHTGPSGGGSTGPAGIDGPTGPQGHTGPSGAGSAGPTGPIGSQGPTGPQGETGYSGDSFGIVIQGGYSDITLGHKTLGRARCSGTILGYRIDSYEKDTNNPIISSIDIDVKINGSTIGTASLVSDSTVYDNTLTGWSTNMIQDDKLQYEVISNTNSKNISLTIFINHIFIA